MKLIEERIKKDGKVLPGNVLKVDSFLNHAVDVELINACAEEWYKLFKNEGVTKVMTIETSGITMATLTALKFNVPLIIAKKTRTKISESYLSTGVVSYTHGRSYQVNVCKDYIEKGDKILLIDDFLANGSALKALIALAEEAGAEVVGAGIAIEKTYQGGAQIIAKLGYRIESLAKISSLSDDGSIEFC